MTVPDGYIDEGHNPEDFHLLEVFYEALLSEGGSADQMTLRGIKAVLADALQPPAAGEVADTTPTTLNPAGPTEAELTELAERYHGEPVASMRAALARWGTAAPQPILEALAARPLLERVAQMGDRIGQHTAGEIMQISQQATQWLADNPPGQPVAIEPRVCPTPGTCSCVQPTSTPPAAGEVGDEELLQAYWRAKRDHVYDGPLDDWPNRAERAATVAGLRAVRALPLPSGEGDK